MEDLSMSIKLKHIVIKNRKSLILFISLVIFLLIAHDILEKEIIYYDEWVNVILIKYLRNDFLTMIMKIITNFGSGIVLVTISLLSYLFFKNKNQGISMMINLSIITLINTLLKIIIQRPRPIGVNIITELGYSFPSGHSMISTAFYGFLIYLAYKNVKNRIYRILICISLFFLIIFICISRVYLGVHYTSDVIGGFFISISYLMVFITIVPKFLKIIDNKK